MTGPEPGDRPADQLATWGLVSGAILMAVGGMTGSVLAILAGVALALGLILTAALTRPRA